MDGWVGVKEKRKWKINERKKQKRKENILKKINLKEKQQKDDARSNWTEIALENQSFLILH